MINYLTTYTYRAYLHLLLLLWLPMPLLLVLLIPRMTLEDADIYSTTAYYHRWSLLIGSHWVTASHHAMPSSTSFIIIHHITSQGPLTHSLSPFLPYVSYMYFLGISLERESASTRQKISCRESSEKRTNGGTSCTVL